MIIRSVSKRVTRTALAVCGALSIATVPAVSGTAQELMDALKVRMQGANTYAATMKLDVNIPFLKAPPSEAKIWYKAPNKTHIESEGFAMIPKQGADLSAATLLSAPYTAFDSGLESFHGTMMRKVRIIPIDEEADIAVATVWVDTTMMVPRKVVSTSRRGGTFTAELVYDNAKARAYCLPSYVKLFFDIGNFKLPKTMTGDFKKDDDGTPAGGASGASPSSDAAQNKAIVQIWYTNYKINVLIDDSVFEE